ncbi:MAG: hypothetical protein F6J98_43775, partial [Moorea sp. SIO4G2]|nr:hypothetical protein [Moorena sp. SIO4G2]
SLTRREIQVNLKQGLNDETNPLLWNNDIIPAPCSLFSVPCSPLPRYI